MSEGIDLEALVRRLRDLGVVKYKTSDIEIVLGPAPYKPRETATEGETEELGDGATERVPDDRAKRRRYYETLIGRKLSDKELERLP